jgi:hypothetical protein
LALFGRRGEYDVTEAYVLVEVSVVRNGSGDANDENVFNVLEN